MEFNEALIKVRQKVIDAVRLNIIDKSLYEATLIQLLKDVERRRRKCLDLERDHLRDAAKAKAEAQGYQSMYTVIYSVLNGFVEAAEHDVKEALEKDEEDREEEEELTDEEKQAVAAIAKKQEEAQKQKEDDRKEKVETARARGRRKATKKTAKK